MSEDKMKLYVFTARKLMINIVAVILLITVIATNYDNAKVVFRSETIDELPIYCVETDKKVCALSFDAAWGAEDTDQLIQILDNYNVKATFFVVGDWVNKYPDAVKKLHTAGHDIMNHSDTHQYMTKLDKSTLISEVENCSIKIESLTGIKPILFRAPYGDYNSSVVSEIKKLGYYTIQWDVDSLDWKDYSSEDIYSRVISKTKNGSIILFHNAAKNTPDALPKILEKLKNDGFSFVKIKDLIYKDNYYIDNTGKQIKE